MPALVTGITGVLAAFKATAIGTFLTSTFTGKLLASVALSALQAVITAPQQRNGGFTTQYTVSGGTIPCSFVLGLYGIGGQNVCPPMTHGKVGKTPNAYLTYVIKLGDIPGQSLERLMIDGAYVARGAVAHADYGLPATGRYAGYAWFKFYDGTQTVADPMLLAKYGSYPERPWLSDMVGTGCPYVICTFRFNRELFGGLPQNLFESGGIPLYDPRFDTTVGGSGTQRWGIPSTYLRSTNPAVIDYNIARGITIPQLGVWGGDFIAEDLPLGNWFTAMNACDLMVGSPLRKQFQGGYPVQVSMEPAGVMELFGMACTAQFAEVGGLLKMRVGGPGLPVLFITDGDIIVSRPQDYAPFPNAASRQNGIETRYADPAIGWKDKAAPPRYNTTWEAEDGARRTTSIDLPACSDSDQAQRVMAAYITDARRARPHGLTLPPDAAVLEPLDVISWTSTWNTYTAKLFEVSQLADDMLTMLQQISVRECDPADFVPPTGLVLPGAVSSAPVIPVAQTLPGWAVAPRIIADAVNASRQPGIIAIWDGSELDDAISVQYELRVAATGSMVKVGTVSNVAGGQVIVADGVLRNTAYEMRGLLVVEGRASNWTAWTAVTSPNIASVNAGEIGSGAVNLGNIVGQTYGGAAENPGWDMSDAAAWILANGASIVTLTDGVAGQFALEFPATVNDDSAIGLRIPVDINKPYIIRSAYRRVGAAAGTLYFRVYHYNSSDVFIGYNDHAIGSGAVTTLFQNFTSPLLVFTAGTAYVRLRAIGNYTATVGGVHQVQAFRLDEMISQEILQKRAATTVEILRSATGFPVNVSTTLVTLPSTATFAAGSFKDFDFPGAPISGKAKNPIVVRGNIKVAGSTTSHSKLVIKLQYFVTAWITISEDFELHLDPRPTGSSSDVAFSMVVDGSAGTDASNWTGMRLSGQSENFTPYTGLTVQVQSLEATVEQLNR